MTAEDDAKGAGTGAFKITGYVPDSKVDTGTPIAAYWDGAPKLAGIERPVIIDAGTRHDEYVRGDLDMLQFESPGDLDNDSKDPCSSRDQVKLFKRASTYYIGLNQKAFPGI